MSDTFIQQLSSGKNPFILFKPPGQGNPVKAYLQSHQKPVTTFRAFDELPEAEGFVMAPFNFPVRDKGIYIQKDHENQWADPASLTDLVIDLSGFTALPEVIVKEEYDAYSERFHMAQNLLQEGHFQKVVLSRRWFLPNAQPIPAGKYFQGLTAKYPGAFLYLAFIPGQGMWMGATPEPFLKWEDGTAYTVALAGTLPAGSNFPWGAKEKDEQQYVTDHIYAVLKNAGASDIQVSGPATAIAGQLQHLKTTFSAKVKERKMLPGLITELHPTPAVCGMPKQKAQEFIFQQEYDRGFYTGITGVWHPGQTIDLYVNLRCMQAGSNGYCLFAGGGITKGSVLEKEWEETNWKLKTMQDVLSNRNNPS